MLPEHFVPSATTSSSDHACTTNELRILSDLLVVLLLLLPLFDAVDALAAVLEVWAMHVLVFALLAWLLGSVRDFLQELRILQRHALSVLLQPLVLSLQLLQVRQEFGSFLLGFCCLYLVVFEVACPNLTGLDFGGVGKLQLLELLAELFELVSFGLGLLQCFFGFQLALLVLSTQLVDETLLDCPFLLDLLDFCDILVEFDQQRRKLRIDFVEHIRVVLIGLVVDVLKEHDSRKVLLKAIDLSRRERLGQQLQQLVVTAGFDAIQQQHHFLLELDDLRDFSMFNAPSEVFHPDLLAQFLNLLVGLTSNLVDKVSDSQLRTFGEDVLDATSLNCFGRFNLAQKVV